MCGPRSGGCGRCCCTGRATSCSRLTPRNNDALLFDGLPWVDRAQEEHDAFADALRDRGVEVLYLTRLLVETLADPAARARAIELTLTDIRLGDSLRRFLGDFLADLDAGRTWPR